MVQEFKKNSPVIKTLVSFHLQELILLIFLDGTFLRIMAEWLITFYQPTAKLHFLCSQETTALQNNKINICLIL